MTASVTRLRRSVLYVPASNARALAKCRQLAADAIVFDLEDAVAPAVKAQAREQLFATFEAGGLGPRETVIRINAASSAEHAADLALVARCRPDAVLLPKVEHPEDLATLAQRLQALGADPRLGLWAMVETSAALLQLDAIVARARALPLPLQCLVLGSNDLQLETGVEPGADRSNLLPWLLQLVLVAKRHRVGVLDAVCNNFDDAEQFNAEAEQARALGFDGKTVIHPKQIDAANASFAPTPEALAQARAVVTAFADPAHAEHGAIQLDGRMVERLHLEQAQRLLMRQAAIDARQTTA